MGYRWVLVKIKGLFLVASREKGEDIYFKKNSYFKKGIFKYWTKKEEGSEEWKEGYFWKKKMKSLGGAERDIYGKGSGKRRNFMTYWSKIGHFGKTLVKHWKKKEVT